MTCLPEPEPHPTQQSLTQGRGHKHSNIFMRISLGVKYEDCRTEELGRGGQVERDLTDQ